MKKLKPLVLKREELSSEKMSNIVGGYSGGDTTSYGTSNSVTFNSFAGVEQESYLESEKD